MNKLLTYYKKAITPPFKPADIPVIALTVIVGISLLLTIITLRHQNTNNHIHAQSISNAFEPENGTASGNGSIGSDQNASGGNNLGLNSLPTLPPTPSIPTPIPSDPFISMVTSPAPVGSGSLAPLLGLNTHHTDNTAQLDAAKAAGFTWIKTDLAWDDVEKSKGVYNFSAYDSMLNNLEARSLKPLWVLDYGNTLYTRYEKGVRTAAERTAFGNYAEAAAHHFAGHGVRYEIWNEPDGAFWEPSPNVSQYAELLKSVRPRIRTGDPSALVTTGGLRMFDLDDGFFQTMLSSGAVNGYDAVAVHSYWLTGDPETIFDRTNLPLWRSLKNQYSMGSVQDWMTEFGYGLNEDWGGGTPGNDATKYAALTARSLLSQWAGGFKMIVVYDADADGGGQGLLNPPNILGYQAVSTLSQMAKGRIFTNFIVPGDNTQLNALRIEGPSDITYVMWMRNGSKTIQIPQGTTIKDMIGAAITPSGGQLTITSTQGPVYLTLPK